MFARITSAFYLEYGIVAAMADPEKGSCNALRSIEI